MKVTRDNVLFDINETVLDLSPLRGRFAEVFGDASIAPTWFSMLLHASTVCAVTETQSDFASLAGHMLDSVASRAGVKLSDDNRQRILSSFASLSPHADVIPALSQLRSAGYRTVAFSNSSLKLIQAQIENAGLSKYFDQVISVETTGSFKPDPKVYRFAAEQVGRPIEALRLVATHDWDTHGALCAGMQAAHIDRSGSPYLPVYQKPEIRASSMEAIVEAIIKADC